MKFVDDDDDVMGPIHAVVEPFYPHNPPPVRGFRVVCTGSDFYVRC